MHSFFYKKNCFYSFLIRNRPFDYCTVSDRQVPQISVSYPGSNIYCCLQKEICKYLYYRAELWLLKWLLYRSMFMKHWKRNSLSTACGTGPLISGDNNNNESLINSFSRVQRWEIVFIWEIYLLKLQMMCWKK